MVEAFGVELGTPFQGGALVTLVAIFGVALRTYIIGMPERAKIVADREANLLNERAEEMRGMRERLGAIEAKLEEKERSIEAERTMYRHRISNLGQAFHALLMLLKKGVPVNEAVEEIERLRAEQLDREVAEASMFRAAGLRLDIGDPEKGPQLHTPEGSVR